MLGCRTILMICSSRFSRACQSWICRADGGNSNCTTNLEALVLQNPLDGCIFVRGGQLGLENHAKRSIAYNLALGVLDFASLASDAILDLFTDNFYKYIVSIPPHKVRVSHHDAVSPPIRRVLNAAGRVDAMFSVCRPSPCYRSGQLKDTGGGR